MSRSFRILSALFLVTAVCALRAVAAEITVVRSFPANGDGAVDPAAKYIRVRFSEPIQRGGWSFTSSNIGEPIDLVPPALYEDNDQVIVMGLKLKPSTTYWLSINSARHQNFRAAAPPNTPVTPYVIQFRTAAARVKPAPKKAPKPPKAPKAPTVQKSRKPVTRAQAWREDIDYLARELPARHPDFFFRAERG